MTPMPTATRRRLGWLAAAAAAFAGAVGGFGADPARADPAPLDTGWDTGWDTGLAVDADSDADADADLDTDTDADTDWPDTGHS